MPIFDFKQSFTHSWSTSLGNTLEEHAATKEWLRSEFFKLRDRAGLLLKEINRDLPDLTQHDLSHCDALWEMADAIGGEGLDLNPMEGFVLGAVFLLHDAALSLAALPGRLEELRKDSLWADTVVTVLRKHLGRQPTADDLAKVDDGRDKETQQWVAAIVLRARHADYALHLATRPYTDTDGEQFYLIEDEALRTHFGRDIGRIAASHGMSLEWVSKNFSSQPLLPPVAGSCPPEWQVNRLKVACLLRTCDAVHLDSRRAPGFLRALRKPSVGSDPHWQFQRRISVTRDGDRIRFVSGFAFPASEARAWWTGYELIQNADREIRQVDALLADTGHRRFTARSVFGADSPKRLKETVPTDGWEPVEARVRVSNVAEVAKSLGGESLYGQHSRTVPLRELIQNASDAVRARRFLEPGNRYVTHDLGEVIVRQGHDEYGHWVEVEDNGLGMSTSVLTGALLDFGSSLWNTPQQHQEWPGLSGQGFEATGRFGIGFFSVFMWGGRVRVTSRRFDLGRDTTRVLEWHKGLDWHPLLRNALPEEYIDDGGTRVRVWTTLLTGSEAELETKLPRHWNLESLCMTLCPTLDTHLFTETIADSTLGESSSITSVLPIRKQIVKANDWIDCDGKELLRRIWSDYHNFNSLRSPEDLESISQMLRPLYRDGKVVGRASIFNWRMASDLFGSSNVRSGSVTVGGLRAAELLSLAGVLLGEPTRVTRDEAKPLVDAEELARWATEQAPLFAGISTDFNQQVGAAITIRMCGGLTGPLFITAAGHPEGYVQLSHEDIVEMDDFPDELIFLDFDILQGARLAQSIRLHSNVFLTSFEYPSLLSRTEYMRFINWPTEVPQRISQVVDPDWRSRFRTLFGALIEAVAARWECTVDEVLAASTLKNTQEDTPPEREVGLINDKPFTQQVGLLRRPRRE